MSLHSLSELFIGLEDVVENDEEGLIQCLAGYGLNSWIGDATLGWDDGLGTYFMHLGMGGDTPIWWFGGKPSEIASPFMFREIFKLLFKEARMPEFDQETLTSLLNDREKFLKTKYSGQELNNALSALSEFDRKVQDNPSAFVDFEYVESCRNAC